MMDNVDILRCNGFYDEIAEYVAKYNSDDVDGTINAMSRGEVIEAYLEYNGIMGYASSLIDLFTALFNSDEYEDGFRMLSEADFDMKLNGDEAL